MCCMHPALVVKLFCFQSSHLKLISLPVVGRTWSLDCCWACLELTWAYVESDQLLSEMLYHQTTGNTEVECTVPVSSTSVGGLP